MKLLSCLSFAILIVSSLLRAISYSRTTFSCYRSLAWAFDKVMLPVKACFLEEGGIHAMVIAQSGSNTWRCIGFLFRPTSREVLALESTTRVFLLAASSLYLNELLIPGRWAFLVVGVRVDSVGCGNDYILIKKSLGLWNMSCLPSALHSSSGRMSTRSMFWGRWFPWPLTLLAPLRIHWLENSSVSLEPPF